MEVYVLDALLRRKFVIDKFESLIWTERWNEIGDFELVMKSTLENRTLLPTGTHLAVNTSMRVMVVETVEDSVKEDGKMVFTVKGRTLERMFEDRVYKDSLTSFTDPMILEGSPRGIAEGMFDHICRPPGALSPYDEIPFLVEGSIFPPDDILEPMMTIRWEQRVDSLYNALRGICGTYDLGFRLVRNFDTSQLYFDVYSGRDRTTRQIENQPVIFAANLENLRSSTEFVSDEKAKNVAYVFSEGGHAIVYGDGVDPEVEGFERRVLMVQAPDDPAAPSWQDVMEQAGREALLNSRPISIFDGEIDQRSSYVYGVDYHVGDYVELRNKDGIITYKRVTEQIMVDDANGERSYPTLSGGEFVSSGTWFAYNNDDTAWIDMTTEYWQDM